MRWFATKKVGSGSEKKLCLLEAKVWGYRSAPYRDTLCRSPTSICMGRRFFRSAQSLFNESSKNLDL